MWEALGISEGRPGILASAASPDDTRSPDTAASEADGGVSSTPGRGKHKAKGKGTANKGKGIPNNGKGISDERKGTPTKEGASVEKGEGKDGEEEPAADGGGALAVPDGKRKKARKTGEERFTAFFESVLGLAMGEWPRGQPPGAVAKKSEANAVVTGRGAESMDVAGEGDDADAEEVAEEEDEKENGEYEEDNAEEAVVEGERGARDGGSTAAAAAAAVTESEEAADLTSLSSEPPAKKARKASKKGESGAGKVGGKRAKGGVIKNGVHRKNPRKRGPRVAGWEGLSPHERIVYITFMVNVFQSLEEPVVRANVLRLASLPLWGSLQPGRLALELKAFPQLKRHYQHLKVWRGHQRNRSTFDDVDNVLSHLQNASYCM